MVIDRGIHASRPPRSPSPTPGRQRGEAGERGLDVGAVADLDGTARRAGRRWQRTWRCGDRRGLVAPSAADPGDRRGCGCRRACGSASMPSAVEPVGHDLDAVALLDPQFLGPGQHRLALGAGGGDEQRRELVDGERHLVLRDADPAAAAPSAPADPPPARRRPCARSSTSMSAPMARRMLMTPVAGRVDADVPQGQVGARRRCSPRPGRRRRRRCPPGPRDPAAGQAPAAASGRPGCPGARTA